MLRVQAFIFLAAAAALHSTPGFQTPVRGEPGGLVLVPGSGFTDSATVTMASDATPPLRLPIVARSDHALVVRLPRAPASGQPLKLAIGDTTGPMRASLWLNRATPWWTSPAIVDLPSTSAAPAVLKVIGRNLQEATQPLEVRLVGSVTHALRRDAAASGEFVWVAPLPGSIAPGHYAVEARTGGTGAWSRLGARGLTVRAPAVRAEFPVDAPRFGDCRADDARDDLPCVVRALAAAAVAGGTVRFGPGEWQLRSAAGVGSEDGLVVPKAVALSGAGAARTRLVWSSPATAPPFQPLFTLEGDNRIEGLAFRDDRAHTPDGTAGAFLRLGRTFYRASSPRVVPRIVITGNDFSGARRAIGDGGQSLHDLRITDNTFMAYETAVALGGNRYRVDAPYALVDAVITHNRFLPGTLRSSTTGEGPIASEIGGAQRLDFSANVADGAAATPGALSGWRAAFFWHLNGPQEQLLVAGNRATCTGDALGDGEAFAFDNNTNTQAYATLAATVATRPASITLAGALATRQHERQVDAGHYYVGHWVRIASGPGLGQIRRITGYRRAGEATTFAVAPAWDVLPVPGASRAVVAREYWQVLVIDNVVDHRAPPCRTDSAGQHGGAISLWGQGADLVVAGNRQFDTDGIAFQMAYDTGRASLLSFVEIRDNLISGTRPADCNAGGIHGSHGSMPTGPAPPMLGFAIDLSGNHITGQRGSAIAVPLTWHAGPPPGRATLVRDLLVQHNRIGPAATAPSCKHGRQAPIDLSAKTVTGTVLLDNACGSDEAASCADP